MTVRAVFGLPAYNRADYLPEALESLLGQTLGDFAIVVVDDRSADATLEIVERYRRLDPRISLLQNESRGGMIANWRRAFDQSVARHAGLEFFAWASDHDVWHPRWLERMVAALDSYPDAVVAYPYTVRISERGDVLLGPGEFDTLGVEDPAERFRRAWWGMSAGNMIYGLFRARALSKAGVFRPVLMPDRALFAELAIYGQFCQVREILWFRRFAVEVTMERQRRSFFPGGAPTYSYLHWSTMHGAVLAWSLCVRGTGRPLVGRALGLRCAAEALAFGAWMDARKRLPRRLRRGRLLARGKRKVAHYARRIARLARRGATEPGEWAG